ncbi:GvpL/GvpF family gas vesicle protein [Streptomyces sp. ISL-98]|uniref:GvpL/GvpF family gas vesicle protein n=1 Tax=Streptomyces sp. ISL-98 TaxID=2819192 RepID=UPI001BE89397|nr:GvpL/GvpF family gas vesicle protein [Streptomyces sp. ISL-98]MBT2507814.1 GvpL/GvpF family gas vesicle protein [Streptomyces sp. ISL-98]
MTESCVTWLYAVAFDVGPNNHLATEVTGVTGVAGETVHVVKETCLAGFVGSVPAKDFGEQELHHHLQDRGWLEEAARAHHEVICTVGLQRNIVPFPFATIYQDDDRVRSLLAERRTDFVAALDRAAGRREWGVKAYAAPRAPEHHDARAARAADGDDRAEQIHDALRDFAVETAQLPPAYARPAGHKGSVILNSSYLVPDIRTEEFTAEADALRERFPDVRIELAGPWPAYSFTSPDASPVLLW